MRPFLLAIALLAGPSPDKWPGTWILDIAKSTFGPILFPGVPPDLRITSQQLRIEIVDSKLRLSGDTGVNLAGKPVRQKNETTLSLDGTPSQIGPANFVLHPIDDY